MKAPSAELVEGGAFDLLPLVVQRVGPALLDPGRLALCAFDVGRVTDHDHHTVVALDPVGLVAGLADHSVRRGQALLLLDRVLQGVGQEPHLGTRDLGLKAGPQGLVQPQFGHGIRGGLDLEANQTLLKEPAQPRCPGAAPAPDINGRSD